MFDFVQTNNKHNKKSMVIWSIKKVIQLKHKRTYRRTGREVNKRLRFGRYKVQILGWQKLTVCCIWFGTNSTSTTHSSCIALRYVLDRLRRNVANMIKDNETSRTFLKTNFFAIIKNRKNQCKIKLVIWQKNALLR